MRAARGRLLLLAGLVLLAPALWMGWIAYALLLAGVVAGGRLLMDRHHLVSDLVLVSGSALTLTATLWGMHPIPPVAALCLFLLSWNLDALHRAVDGARVSSEAQRRVGASLTLGGLLVAAVISLGLGLGLAVRLPFRFGVGLALASAALLVLLTALILLRAHPPHNSD
jgi:hypothetical protein